MSTSDSCERNDPATPTPGIEEAIESPVPTEAEAHVVPPPSKNGRRGERRPQESQRGTPSNFPKRPRPSEERVGGRGGGAGRLASQEAEAEAQQEGRA